MRFDRERVGNVEVLILPGNTLDVTNSHEFKRDTEPVIKENPHVVLDMCNIRFVDSSGCGAILSCLRKARSGNGDIKMCNLAEQIVELFKLIRLDRIIEIHKQKKKAINSFSD